MKHTLMIFAVALCATLPGRLVLAHCEVPCGIYDDQARFESMLEDTETIAKASASLGELVEAGDAQSLNQAVRWITTKDDHATNIQHTISQYFMTQRIKPTDDNYEERLTAAHAVMVAAMKCKQNVEPETAEALEEAILDFYRAYEGREPEEAHEHTHE